MEWSGALLSELSLFLSPAEVLNARVSILPNIHVKMEWKVVPHNIANTYTVPEASNPKFRIVTKSFGKVASTYLSINAEMLSP